MTSSTHDSTPDGPQPASSPLQRRIGGDLSAALDGSPRQVAQRQRIDAVFGDVAQRAVEDDWEDAEPVAQAMTAQRQPNLTGMPDGLKAGMESLSGMDLSGIRVHANSSAPAQLNALAYAQGNDIHLAPGQEQHLPHEAWHVVQQAQGRVQPTMQMAGVDVNDDAGLEAEADAMGEQALREGSGSGAT